MRSIISKLVGSVRSLLADPVRMFGLVSVVLVLLLAVAPAKDHFSEWHHYQQQYRRLIAKRSDAATLQRHFVGGVRQVWLPQVGVVDRCESCHSGLTEASLTDVPQPFRTHPPIPHGLDEFGCVICHRGQGAATTVAEAHDSKLAHQEPILPARFVESSCGQCHHAALMGTPKLNRGREMLARYGCVRCHTVKLPDGSTMTATDDPPPLTHIADKTSREWIYAWLKDPKSYAGSATMPNFHLSDDDARDISAFLIAASTPQPEDTATLPAAALKAAADPSGGASLYGESFCASCHAMQNAAGDLTGGNVGPELTRIGTKVKPEWLVGWLRDPRHYDEKTQMPRYRWTDQQVALLAGFLENKTDSDLLSNVQLAPATAAQIKHGRSLVIEYGCAACHEIPGIKRPENFAPELSRVGSKPLEQIVFADDVPHTLPDYLAGKLREPRAFGPGLRMPDYGFSHTQLEALTTALLSLTDRSFTLPQSLQVATTAASSYVPAGHAGKLMMEMNCQACHRINGRGGDMAPDLSWEGSSVQRAWLDDFLKNPNTLRPALIRRMPRFNMTDAERAELTDYIMTVYQSPVLDRDTPLTSSPELIDKGRQLFYSKYACQSCHIVDAQRDKGYIGPPLTQVGSRLTAVWIEHWLQNPQALRPGTLEPNQKIPEDEAQALTAFLMAQRGGRATGTSKQEAKR
ncbi:MAG: c-type cytochrome [Acidobacteriota bacterium]|nr:c-type cytochrome [Acidobacteriota bacterium]